MKESARSKVNRRDFLKLGAAAGLGAMVWKPGLEAPESEPRRPAGDTLIEFKAPPVDPVRVGFVGVGSQGSAHVRNFLKIEGVEVKAVCDIVEDKVTRIQDWCEETGRPRHDEGKEDEERQIIEESTAESVMNPGLVNE